ncbi:MAG: chemotaxis-specific protein-glutamate methyltransferase CheB, partial [Spirochaetia bacterium]|nr:chemotaxis-specific protein-glutamate methyltransferase CheB [Spirochaetia bacterium]
MITLTPTRVLIIEDSRATREFMRRSLNAEAGIEVVGTAGDVFEARDQILRLKPDLCTLDLELPGMDGLTFLRQLLPQYPIPMIVVSSLTQPGMGHAMKALECGAVDVVPKPSSEHGLDLKGMMTSLIEKIHNHRQYRIQWRMSAVNEDIDSTPSARILEKNKVIVVGASTGGPIAVHDFVKRFPVDMPGTVIVIHMPSGFTTLFAKRLNEEVGVNVKEAEDGEVIETGKVFIAPAGRQCRIRAAGSMRRIVLGEEAKVNGHSPAVDPLFFSAAEEVGADTYGVLLTGMGRDGAHGLLKLREAGAFTFAQSEETCVVYG